MITTATTQQQPAFSCFSEKKKKKRIKSDYFYYFHISTFPLDIMWISQCWLLLSSVTRNWQRPVLVKDGTFEGRTRCCEGSERKRNVCWKETCRRRSFHIWKELKPQFHGFWGILLSVCCQALVFWCEQVWTGVFEGWWMFVFRLVARTQERKSKRKEMGPEKSCSIVDKHEPPSSPLS